MSLDDLEMAAFARHACFLYGLVGDCLDLGVIRAQLPLQGFCRNDVTDVALGCALIEVDCRPLPEADFFDGFFTDGYLFNLGNFQRLFAEFQVAQEADILGHFKMFVFRDLEMAGIAGQLLAFQGLVAKMRLVFEAHLLGEFQFLVLKFFDRMAARLQTSPVFDDRTNWQWRFRVVQIGGEMPQPFHFGFESVFLAGQEVTVDAFSLRSLGAFRSVVLAAFPSFVLFGHGVA